MNSKHLIRAGGAAFRSMKGHGRSTVRNPAHDAARCLSSEAKQYVQVTTDDKTSK